MSGDTSSVVILLIEALATECVVASIKIGFCEDMSGGRDAKDKLATRYSCVELDK